MCVVLYENFVLNGYTYDLNCLVNSTYRNKPTYNFCVLYCSITN